MKKLLVLGWLFLLAALPAQAQQNLTLFTPETGHIDSGGAERWTFSAVEGSVLSFLVQGAGEFDPQLSISNSAGAVVIANDDYQYPASRDALLEAITMPRTDTYTATITGAGSASGDYTLTMLAGYGQISLSENFNGATNWSSAVGPVETAVEDGSLRLTLDQAGETGTATNASASIPAVYFAQVSVSVEPGHDNWVVGMTARQTSSRYYLLAINEQGQWRFLVRDGGVERVIRDWTPHPAIIPGSKTFTLAMLVNGTSFDFFVNGGLIGRLSDPTIPDGGTLGLAVQTSASRPQAGARFDNLTITTPLLVDGAPVLPTQLIVGAPATMALELQRRNVIPAGGDMALTIAESFAESARPGVDRFMLGRGSSFTQLALGTAFTWEAGAAGMTGCGLVLQQTDNTHYLLAYADRMGGFGLSRREDETFQPGVFGEKPVSNKTSYHLLVVVLSDQTLYYVDGALAGSLDTPAITGAVGNAVVNFEPINTSCRFADTWVWRWN